MIPEQIFAQILENFDAVLHRKTAVGNQLWQELQQTHPADIADFLQTISRERFDQLLQLFALPLKQAIFEFLSDSAKAHVLTISSNEDRHHFLESMLMSEFADMIDFMDDETVEACFKLLQRKDRQVVMDILAFNPESAGGVMETNVISLFADFTVQKSIQILQKIRPNQELHEILYVTDKHHRLIGHILLQDLVLKNPITPLHDFMQKNELVAQVDQDQEEIAQLMKHYQITMVPVVGEEDKFLGVIPSSILVDIIEQEASEDVYKISALRPIKHAYFETPFSKLFIERSSILIVLLLVESFTSTILQAFEATLASFLIYYMTMLTSTGGNASSQTSALVIQGLAAGDLNYANFNRFIRREMLMALALAAALGIATFLRVLVTQSVIESIAIATSIAVVAFVSVTLGSFLPLLLKKMGADPAFSAGPFLATVMDIVGLIIYCTITALILRSLHGWC